MPCFANQPNLFEFSLVLQHELPWLSFFDLDICDFRGDNLHYTIRLRTKRKKGIQKGWCCNTQRHGYNVQPD